MGIDVSNHGKGVIVRLYEHVSHTSRGALQDQVEKSLMPETEAVYFDMRAVEFINSIAIGDLVGTKLALDNKAIPSYIVAPSEAVAKMLKYARLDEIFSIIPELPSGLTA